MHSTFSRPIALILLILLPLLGGRAIYNDSPVIRYWLNLNAARAHVANDPNNFGPDVTATLMGEKPGFMFM